MMNGKKIPKKVWSLKVKGKLLRLKPKWSWERQIRKSTTKRGGPWGETEEEELWEDTAGETWLSDDPLKVEMP
jgi:hypothetical protein